MNLFKNPIIPVKSNFLSAHFAHSHTVVGIVFLTFCLAFSKVENGGCVGGVVRIKQPIRGICSAFLAITLGDGRGFNSVSPCLDLY